MDSNSCSFLTHQVHFNKSLGKNWKEHGYVTRQDNTTTHVVQCDAQTETTSKERNAVLALFLNKKKKRRKKTQLCIVAALLARVSQVRSKKNDGDGCCSASRRKAFDPTNQRPPFLSHLSVSVCSPFSRFTILHQNSSLWFFLISIGRCHTLIDSNIFHFLSFRDQSPHGARFISTQVGTIRFSLNFVLQLGFFFFFLISNVMCYE